MHSYFPKKKAIICVLSPDSHGSFVTGRYAIAAEDVEVYLYVLKSLINRDNGLSNIAGPGLKHTNNICPFIDTSIYDSVTASMCS